MNLLNFDLLQLEDVPAVIGVDEAGRGPLAGPVSAAAVYLDKDFYNSDWAAEFGSEINDSKQQISSVARKLTICHTTTETNFLHFDFGSNKKRAEKNLRNQKVLASGGVGVPGYEQFLRITLGPFNMMQPVIDELHASK